MSENNEPDKHGKITVTVVKRNEGPFQLQVSLDLIGEGETAESLAESLANLVAELTPEKIQTFLDVYNVDWDLEQMAQAYREMGYNVTVHDHTKEGQDAGPDSNDPEPAP